MVSAGLSAVEAAGELVEFVLEAAADDQLGGAVKVGGIRLGDVEVGVDLVEGLGERGMGEALQAGDAGEGDVEDGEGVTVAVDGFDEPAVGEVIEVAADVVGGEEVGGVLDDEVGEGGGAGAVDELGAGEVGAGAQAFEKADVAAVAELGVELGAGVDDDEDGALGVGGWEAAQPGDVVVGLVGFEQGEDAQVVLDGAVHDVAELLEDVGEVAEGDLVHDDGDGGGGGDGVADGEAREVAVEQVEGLVAED